MSQPWVLIVVEPLQFNRGRRCIFSLIALLFMLESTSASVCSSITQPLFATTGTQYLSSPNYPSQYPTGKTCVWSIAAPSNYYVIKIQFTNFDLQYNFGLSCSSTDDSLEIRDGSSSSSNLINIYCQSNKPELNKGIYSSGRYLYLKFKSDSFSSLLTDSGFKILYTAISKVCSTVTQPLFATTGSQYLGSPNYPFQYPTGETCVWNITAPSDNYIIKIQFTNFDLQNDYARCSSTVDSLEIRDGSSSSSDLINIYCEKNKPELNKGIYSSGRYLYLKFKSDSFSSLSTDTGFQISYTAISKVTTCSSSHSDDQNSNILLSGSSGIIYSPNFPLSYPNRIKCIWRIKLSNNTDIVNISFTSFKIESSYDRSCRDYLEIFDGYKVTGVSLGRFCGTKAPPNIYTRGNKLTVVLKSDSFTGKKGFSASYSSVSSSGFRGSCAAPFVKNNISVANSAGVITSPNYPADYPKYMDCTWRINVSSEKRVKLYFLGTFKLDDNCGWYSFNGYLQIRDGSSSTGKSLGKFCGSSKPPSILTSKSSATVQFKTGSGMQNKGFYLVYEEVYEKNVQYEGYCSPYLNSPQTFELTNTSGTIMSPNYPNHYPQNMECIWKVSVRDGKRVKFVMEDMNLESPSGCYKDYVEVRDGYSSYSFVLKTYCGYSKGSAIFSTDRYMWIKFSSGSSSEYSKGFKAKFQEADKSVQYEGYCSPHLSSTQTFELTNTSGTIMSPNYPNYPNNYPWNIECIWKVSVRDGKRVKFVMFCFESPYSCYKDYVQVRDGYYYYSSVLKTYCGYSKGSAIFSTDRYMWIKFRSDSSSKYSKGFKAKFQEADKNDTISHQAIPQGNASVGMIVGIVVGAVIFTAIVIAIAYCCYKSNRNRGAGYRLAAVVTSRLQQGEYPPGGYPQGGLPQSQQSVTYTPAQKDSPPSDQISYPAPPPQENYPQQDLPPPPSLSRTSDTKCSSSVSP